MDPIAIPKAEILKMSNSYLYNWITQICPELEGNNIKFKIIRQIIKDKYRPIVENLLIQPFPKNFGLKNNVPTKEFEHFLEPANLLKIASAFSFIFATQTESENLLKSLLPTKKILCIGSILMYSQDTGQMWKLTDEIDCNLPYLQYINDYINVYDPSLDTIKLKEFCEILKIDQTNEVRHIKECVKTADILYVALRIRVVKTVRTSETLKFGSQDFIGHAVPLIVDLKSSPITAYILDPSVNEPSKSADVLLSVLEQGTLATIRRIIGEKVKLVALSDDRCPRFSIQGLTDLCATWTFYLVMLWILNYPVSRVDIYKTLQRYDQEDRDRLILRFMFYIYTKNELVRNYDFIPRTRRIPDAKSLWK